MAAATSPPPFGTAWLNAESLLHAHTNLVLASQWKDWEAKVLQRDLEMIPEEPEEAQLEQEPEQEPE